MPGEFWVTYFKLRSLESAPEASRPVLQGTLKQFGFLPYLEGQLAAAPAALKAYCAMFDQFESTSLSPAERLVVLLAASVESRDAYGVAAWTHLARQSCYLLPAVIDALRMGNVIGNQRQDSLANLTRQIVRRGGRGHGTALAAFLAAGFQQEQALEVLLGVSLATMGAYASSLLRTPLNWELQPDWWVAPLPESDADPLPADCSAAPLHTHAA
jgi:alkylhydroperoxidase family enzyme